MDKSKDFKKYYCLKLKRHIWVLGYFGGGPVNVESFKNIAEKFSKETNIVRKEIYIDEIFSSRRFKGFKLIYSPSAKNQKPLEDSHILEDVFEWLTD